jgi:hypothetical protein
VTATGDDSLNPTTSWDVPDRRTRPSLRKDPQMTSSALLSSEREDLRNALAQHRDLLLRTVQGLSEAQVRLTPTVSQLCLGVIIKHVTLMEEGWVQFIRRGAAYEDPTGEARYEAHAAGFRVTDDETLDDLLERYRQVARHTDELIVSLASLDASHPLPEAPWFEPGTRWTARRALLHILAETAQHAGHADIIREAIDGAKSMG